MNASPIRLHETLVAAGIPIDGVSGDTAETAVIQYRPEATDPQRATGANLLAAFDWSQAAHDAWEEDRHPERKMLRQAAAQAVADLDAFLAIGSPNNAQTLAQVRRHAQILRAVIRRLIQLD